jgi:hypothetical protein
MKILMFIVVTYSHSMSVTTIPFASMENCEVAKHAVLEPIGTTWFVSTQIKCLSLPE